MRLVIAATLLLTSSAVFGQISTAAANISQLTTASLSQIDEGVLTGNAYTNESVGLVFHFPRKTGRRGEHG